MSKQVTYLILIFCLLAALTGCAPAPDAPAQDSALPAEEAVEEESAPTDPPPPPTETSIAEETDAEETDAEETSTEDQTESSPAMALTSPAYNEGEAIPVKFSCDGEDISPELDWFGLPDGTISLTLIFDDPDAPGGTWVHWVLFNIPADSPGLSEGITGVGMDGQNSWSQTGYGGPCPPGGTHRYFFKLYALDTALDLETGATKAALESAMEGHILVESELMGTYSR